MYNSANLSNPQRGKTLLLIILSLSATLLAGVLAGNQLWLVFIAIALVLGGLAFIVQPESITLVVLFVIYTNAAVIAVRFHGVPFAIGASIPLLLAIPLVSKLVFEHQKLVVSPNMLLLLGFLLVQLLGTLFSRDVGAAANNLVTFITEGLILYFLIVNVVRTPQTMRLVIWTLLAAGAFLGGLSFYQQITGTFSNNYWGFAQAGGAGFGTGVENLQGVIQQSRLEGPIGEKNYYAQMMLVLVPLGLFQLQIERSKLLRLLAGVATLAILGGVVLTFSRGVAVGFALMLLVMIILRYVKWQQVVFVLMAAVLLLQLFPQYRQRLSSLESLLAITEQDTAGISGTDASTQSRISEMTAAWLVFLDHPVIGVGPGMYKFYYPEYIDEVGLANYAGSRRAHDLFLEIAADHGVIGLMLFLLIVGVSLRNLAKARGQTIRSHPHVSNMATAFFLAIISYLATGLFLSLAYERYFWLILGLADALPLIATRVVTQESAIEANNGKTTDTIIAQQTA